MWWNVKTYDTRYMLTAERVYGVLSNKRKGEWGIFVSFEVRNNKIPKLNMFFL